MHDIIGNRTITSEWDYACSHHPDNIFIEFVSIDNETKYYSYKEIDVKVHKFANLLIEKGVKKSDLVGLHLHNSPEYLICWLAIAKIGAISVPINEHYKFCESSYILKKCSIKYLIIEPKSKDHYISNLDKLDLKCLFMVGTEEDISNTINVSKEMEKQNNKLKIDVDIDSNDEAVILFTSGTTQHPKGAIYTHANVVFGGIFHAQQMGMVSKDKFLTSMPCYHMDFQQMSIMPCIHTGSTAIVVEHYSASNFWKQIVDHKANFTDTMSIMNRTIMLQPIKSWEKNHCIKQIYFSMGLSDSEKKQFEDRFNVELMNSYGMTETVTAVTCAPIFGDKNWPSVGRPALSYQVKIVDEDNNEVSDGEIGEICILGDIGRTIIKGYYNNEEATNKLLDKDGWLHSGDFGYLQDGWLFFVDRSKNIIKRSGENISSLEVECILNSHNDVVESAVVPYEDCITGEGVKAIIQLKKNSKITSSDLEKYCLEYLSKFKVPSKWKFIDEFPRTSTGKIKKSLFL